MLRWFESTSSHQKDPQLRLWIFFIALSSRKILNCGRGVGRFLEKNQNFFRCFQNALRKWLLIQPENGCLSLLSPCTRRTPCSNKREKPLQAKLDYFFFYCSIKTPKTLENKGFRRYYLSRCDKKDTRLHALTKFEAEKISLQMAMSIIWCR